MAEIAPGEWTRFCAFHPYTTKSMAEDTLGFRWRYGWSSVSSYDGINYLVFVNGDDVVSAFDYPLGRGNFYDLPRFCYDRAEASFVVREKEQSDGSPFYTLVEP